MSVFKPWKSKRFDPFYEIAPDRLLKLEKRAVRTLLRIRNNKRLAKELEDADRAVKKTVISQISDFERLCRLADYVKANTDWRNKTCHEAKQVLRLIKQHLPDARKEHFDGIANLSLVEEMAKSSKNENIRKHACIYLSGHLYGGDLHCPRCGTGYPLDNEMEAEVTDPKLLGYLANMIRGGLPADFFMRLVVRDRAVVEDIVTNAASQWNREKACEALGGHIAKDCRCQRCQKEIEHRYLLSKKKGIYTYRCCVICGTVEKSWEESVIDDSRAGSDLYSDPNSEDYNYPPTKLEYRSVLFTVNRGRGLPMEENLVQVMAADRD